MTSNTLTILHPGEMGASVAAAAASAGNRVLWVAAGRSADTRERAEAAGLTPADTLADALAGSQMVLSVCPPHAALDTARQVAALDFRGFYVDANAVSPATTDEVGRIVETAGARFVDGGLIGPPATRDGTTRLFLAGPHAGAVAAVFQGSVLDARVLDGPANGASALKMCYAAWTKGTTALLADIRALACALDVEAALLAEWDHSQAGLSARSESSVRGNAFKAWRWVAEMHEIADTFRGAGLPDGFHRAAADIYERLEGFKSRRDPQLADVLRALRRDPPG